MQRKSETRGKKDMVRHRETKIKMTTDLPGTMQAVTMDAFKALKQTATTKN